MIKLRLSKAFLEARKRTVTKREYADIPDDYKLYKNGFYWLLCNDHGATCLLKIKPPVDQLPYSIKVHMQRIDWCWTKMGRMYHAYDILMVKFSRLKDTGDKPRIREGLKRVRKLERAIKLQEQL